MVGLRGPGVRQLRHADRVDLVRDDSGPTLPGDRTCRCADVPLGANCAHQGLSKCRRACLPVRRAGVRVARTAGAGSAALSLAEHRAISEPPRGRCRPGPSRRRGPSEHVSEVAAAGDERPHRAPGRRRQVLTCSGAGAGSRDHLALRRARPASRDRPARAGRRPAPRRAGHAAVRPPRRPPSAHSDASTPASS
jgi:hypothetical protein